MISVVIPSYNHEKYIARCIDSVLKQTYTNFELIVIDDGSVDNSNSIIESYRDKRIIHMKQENAGAHNAINKGLSLAQGDYLSILNSDDEYHKDRLMRCKEILDKEPGIDLVSSWINIVDSNSKNLGVKKAWENMQPWEIQNQSKTYLSSNEY